MMNTNHQTTLPPQRIITGLKLDGISFILNAPGETIAQPVNPGTRILFRTQEPKGPRQPRRIHTVEPDPRECIAIVSLANVVDDRGDLFTRSALAMACFDACERGVGAIRLDVNHRADQPALGPSEVFLRALYMGTAFNLPDAFIADFGFPTPSKLWDILDANLCNGFSCTFRYSLVSDDSAR